MSSKDAGAMGEDNDKKSALVPRLRFPEFREAAAWISKSLKNACEVNPASAELPGKFAYIDLESVETGELKARRIINRDEAPSRAQRLLRYGDVIFQIVRPYQRNNLHFKINEEVPYVASTGYAQLRANESEDFLFQAVHTDDFVERVIAKCTGSSYPAINSSDLADISLPIPSKAEQQKIADCLSSLDELITAETQKLNSLKTHKKGLMQQLFPREGETVPRLRFPGFEGIVSALPLAAIADFVNEKISVDQLTSQQYVSTENLLPDFGGIKSAVKLPSVSSVTCFRPDDVLVSNIRPYLKKVWQADIHGGVSNDVLVVRATERVGADYLAAILRSDIFIDYVMRGAKGVKMPRGEISMIQEFPVPCPSASEQQKIADCLSSLDELITAETQKLNALKTHKKGLMQQLFPSVGGVDGEAGRGG